ncbi:hypothetical protein BDM02DRAFT_3265994 [Thelephora ganbajun]|uniref:Uncharacterized protein n=1 Tax=Thelephora ganbajun TaxID=370292 RepID=A0ACB6ZTX0_THEGA|nr:hypothetical protein BDM02DRAFT_3265994 [Thelephora ganbajun]
MFSLAFWSTTTPEAPSDAPTDPHLSPSELPLPEESHSATEDDNNAVSRDNSVQPTEETSSTTPSSDPQRPTTATSTKPITLDVPEPRPRKASIRSSLSLLRRSADQHQRKPMLDAAHVQQKKRGIVHDLKRAIFPHPSRSKSEKRAKESAEIVRALIIGPNSISLASKKRQALSKVQLDKVKSELAKHKSANKVISELRNLDLATDASAPLPVINIPSQPTTKVRNRGPIHAVCLDKTDEDVEKHYFAQLKPDVPSDTTDLFTESVVTANMDSISSTLGSLHIVDLISSDFGFGQPATGQGIFAGAVPTAETVLTGIRLITPQLMSLGYVTGQAIFPDHKGVYPPTDRLSVLTYWWGFELVLPPPTLVYLQRAQSISKTVVNFLTAMATVNNGVREILPFIRYISQFIEFEFTTITGQDQGLGVVCAATWIMPAALVPRSWDFDPPPGTPNLIPIHKAGPLEQVPQRENTEDKSGQLSGELPPVSLHDNSVPTPPSSKLDNAITDNESLSPPNVTIVPPTLRGLPLAEVQLQA